MSIKPTRCLALLAAFTASIVAGGCTSDMAPGGKGSRSRGMFGRDAAVQPTSGQQPPKVKLLLELKHPLLRTPNRVAISPSGDVVVSDPGGRAVHVFAPWGTHKFSLRDAKSPLSCGVDDQGRIYVGDRATGSVRIHAPTGEQLGQLGKGSGEFSMPNEIEPARGTSVVYVADSKLNLIKAYGKKGQYLFSFGGTGKANGKLNFPTGLVYEPQRRGLWVADHSNGRVQLFDHRGAWLASHGSQGAGKGQFTRPQGLALDRGRRLYVVDAYQGQVQLVDHKGLHISYLGQHGSKAGQLLLPSDAVVDRQGRLLVTSYRSRKVLVFGLDSAPPLPKPLATLVRVRPATIKIPGRGRPFVVTLTIKGRRATQILPRSVTINGVAAPLANSARVLPREGKQLSRLQLTFEQQAVLKALPGVGEQRAAVFGRLSTREHFSGRALITVMVQRGGK